MSRLNDLFRLLILDKIRNRQKNDSNYRCVILDWLTLNVTIHNKSSLFF